MTRPDIIDILEILKSRRLVVRILSNGFRMTKANAQQLAKLLTPYDTVQISLDGPDSAVNDAIRGPGAFSLAVKALQHLASENITTQVSTVLLADNVDALSQTYRLASGLGAQRFVVSSLMRVGRGIYLQAPTTEQAIRAALDLRRVRNEINGPPIDGSFGRVAHIEAVRRLSRERYAQYNANIEACDFGRFRLAVSPMGDVYPCSFLQIEPFYLGDLLSSTVEQVWKQSRRTKLATLRNLSGTKCSRCDFRWCHKNCPAETWALHGTLDKPDPYCEYEPPEVRRSHASAE